MKDKQIGIYFSKLMKKKKITSEELASKINVSVRKIKKYEQGKITGSFETTKKICNELGISVNQLVMGKDELTKEEANESLIRILKHYENRSKKILRLWYIVPITLIILFIPIFMFLHENRDLSYELHSKSENFNIEHFLFIRDNGYYYLIPGHLQITNENISEDNITDVALMSDERLIYRSNRFITEISTEKKGYNELFSNEVVKNIDNWYYKITYTINDNQKTEIVKFDVEDLTK